MVERKEKVKFKKIPKRKEVNNAERIRMKGNKRESKETNKKKGSKECRKDKNEYF